MTLAVRAMGLADIAGGLRLCRASGWNQLEEDWRAIVESPGGAWLLERDGAVIGTAALMRYDALAWVAMMLVDPAERRAGHGARLLAEALAAAKDAPCVGLDATPLGEPLYRQAGFDGSYSLVRMVPRSSGLAAAREGRAAAMTAADLPAVCAMDREIFGADRSALLASLLSRAPESAWVVESRGFCFGRPGYRYHQIGPIVATDGDIARSLAAHAVAALGGRTVVIDAPQHDPQWIEWLKSVGFIEERPFLRMFLRGHIHPGVPSQQYAICGPEFA